MLGFLAVGLSAVLLLAVLPGVERRRGAARGCARAFLFLAAMPLKVKNGERLPQGQCVVVCNHVSYLDGLVLTAALPPRFAFVIKREMASVPLAGIALRRLGSEFVARFDRSQGATDARRVIRNATLGDSQVFFPEGTFARAPGLLKFHTGRSPALRGPAAPWCRRCCAARGVRWHRAACRARARSSSRS